MRFGTKRTPKIDSIYLAFFKSNKNQLDQKIIQHGLAVKYNNRIN